MTQRHVGAVVVFGGAACGGSPPADVPPDGMRYALCEREGTSSVTGAGPAGSLDASHAYALAVSGFCPTEVDLVLTTEDRLATPFLDGSVVIATPVPYGSVDGASEWSGTFAATIVLPDRQVVARGTLQVDAATPGYPRPTRIRATARFADGPWQFTATIDAPYCNYDVCL